MKAIRPRPAGVIATALALVMSACSAQGTPTQSGLGTTTMLPTTSSSPLSYPGGSTLPPTTAPSNVSEVTATDGDKGKTVHLRPGQHLKVTLASTYWQFQPVSNRAVLKQEGKPVVVPQPTGCVPGQGCGTVTANYLAMAPGSAMVTAIRSSCGEAMGCTATSGRFGLTVMVG